jgi:hypothetical protein
LEKVYVLKGTGLPEYYLGGNIDTIQHNNNNGSNIAHIFSAETYITNILETIEKLLETTLKKYESPMEPLYHPEIDKSPNLDATATSKYCMLIVCANWTVTLGHFDIYYAIQMLACYMAAPKEGHFDAMLQVFGYLKARVKGKIIMDINTADTSAYTAADLSAWCKFYHNAKEEIPDDMLHPKGNPVKTSMYYDASHASDLETRRSVSGILFFLNNTPVKWFSKRQATVKSSSYGSEIDSALIASEMAIEVCYKLCMHHQLVLTQQSSEE